MKIHWIAVVGTCLCGLMMGCRHLPVPPAPVAAAVAAEVGTGIAVRAYRARQARARAYYARTRQPAAEPRRSYSDPWGWESEEETKPRPPVKTNRRRGPEKNYDIQIGLTYHSTYMGATYMDHRDYMEDYDETHLGDAFDINSGTIWELAFRLKPRRGIGFRARAEYGTFESDTGFLEIASGLEGLPFLSTSGSADLTTLSLSLQADFALSNWRGGELHLLAGLEYLRADVDTPTITDTVEGLGFDAALELSLVMIPKRFDFELGVELGVGIDYLKAGANAGFCWKPADFVQLRLGLRGRIQSPDDVHSDTWEGESMDLVYGDLYTGLALQF